MRKRVLSFALAASMMLSLVSGLTFPAKAYAADSGSGSSGSTTSQKEIDNETYKDLNLNLSVDESNAPVPYSTTNATSLVKGNEVYVEANGARGNVYTMRDGLDRLANKSETHGRDSDLSDDWGNLDGAYDYYGINPEIKGSKGGTIGSKMSSNRGNSMRKESAGFSGIYATSVEFDAGKGKDNYVAELRAYGYGATSTVDGKSVHGKIEVAIMEVNENGSRKIVNTLSPTLTSNNIYNGDRLSYFTRVYVQDLDALFEIEKADVNGDGKDDLLVYCGAYKDINDNRHALVDVYLSRGDGSFTNGQTLEINCGSKEYFSSSDEWNYFLRRTPVVTIAGGDFLRDGTDEVAIAVSAPTQHSKVSAAAHLSVYSCTNKQTGYLNVINDLDSISLAGSDGKAMVSANVAFGTFTLPNSSVTATALIVGGYQSNNETSNADTDTYGTAAYRFVYINPDTGKYNVSNYTTKGLGSKGYKIADSYSNRRDGHQRPIHAPLALACADLDGMTGSTKNDSVLFGGEVYSFSLQKGIESEIGSISICQKQVKSKKSGKDKEQVWIGDVSVGCVDTDPAKSGYRESFVCVVGTHRDAKTNSGDDYYWMDIATFTKIDGSAFSTQEGVIADSNVRNDNYGTFVSMCLPDIDNDAVRLKYNSKYTLYSNPEVYAVLQASPYFGDVQESYDYVNNGGTSYSTSKGSSESNSGNVSQSVGVYVSAEVQLFGGAEFESEVSAGASYEYERTKSTEYEITYNAAGGGTDQVVVYCEKFIYYVYDMYVPQTASWETLIMPVSMGLSTSIINVDTYDRIAKKTAGLNPIRDSVLMNTPGDPASYKNSLGGEDMYKGKNTENAGYSSAVASAGADQTQTISTTTENSHSLEVFVEVNYKAGAGGGFLGNSAKAGITTSSHAGYGHTWTNSTGTTYSGTVDNLPEECDNYSFDWQLRVNTYQLNGRNNPVWVVGYDVQNVVRPPYAPQNLSIVDVTKSSVELTWDASPDAAYYEIYMIDGSGNYNRKAVVPYTETDHVVGGLYANRTYTFAVRTIDSKGEPSIYSSPATATTLQNNANFKITQNPDDASTYSGGSAEFNASAVYSDDDGKYQTVGYSWQVSDGGEWESLKRGNGPVLKLTNVQNEMDGNEYRCRVYYNDITLYTQAATLTVDKSDSRASLAMYNKTAAVSLKNNDVVEANGTIANSHIEKQKGIEGIQFTDNGVRYSLMTDGTHYIWTDYNGNYYPCTYDIKLDSDDRMEESDKVFSAADMNKEAPYGTTESDYKAEVSVVNESSDGSGNCTLKSTTFNLTKQDEESYKDDSIVYKEIVKGKDDTESEVTVDVNILEKWIDADSKYEFYLLERKNDTDSTIYCYREKEKTDILGEFWLTSTEKLKIDESTSVDYADLAVLDRTVSRDIVVSDDDTVCDGDKIELSTVITSDNTYLTGENVNFVISGPTEEVISAKYDSAKGCYTAEWKPVGEGTFTVYAKYDGNEKYYSCQSDAMTIYTSYSVRTCLSLSVKNLMTYGEEAEFALWEIDSSNGTKTDAAKEKDTKYNIYVKDGDDFKAAVSGTDYILSGNVFTPKKVGIFRVNAEYVSEKGSLVSDSKDIVVSKANIVIKAVDTEKSINDTDRNCAAADVRGVMEWDKAYTPKENTDFTLTSEGTRETRAGSYTIYNTMIKDASGAASANIKYLSKNYNVTLENASYTLTGNVYTVKGSTANTHGDIMIKYQQVDTEISDGLVVDSGTRLPEKAVVTFVATPATGYKVKSWTVNGVKHAASQTGTVDGIAYSNVQIQVESLTKNMNVVVDFEPIYYKLNYASADQNMGTVSAAYIVDGEKGSQFASGSNVHIEQVIRVTADAADGYVLDHWTVTGADGEEHIVLSDDGVSNYTDVIYDVKEITEDQKVKAYFAEAKSFDISVNPVTMGADGSQTPASGVDVTVTAKRDEQTVELERGENGRYNVQKGDNITISVSVPSGLLINGWSADREDAMGTVSKDLKSMTIFNVSGNADYTVTYTAPNRYSVNYAVDNRNAGQIDACITGTTDKLRSGDKQLQGSRITFTATPEDGYEISYWTVDGEKVEAKDAGEGAQTYEIESLSNDASVVVYFYKKPVITFAADNNTGMTAASGGKGIASGSCIAYADKSELTFASDAKKGYELADIVVTYGETEVYRLSDGDANVEDVLTETAGSDGTEKYTFTWKSGDDGFTKDVDVKFMYKKITPVIKAEYSLDVIEKDQTGGTQGKAHGAMTASVTRKSLSAYDQAGDTVSDETAAMTAEISGIYRDSVITFKIAPDAGYNVKEWIVDGQKLTEETDSIKILSDKKTNDTLKITVTSDSKDVKVSAKLELIGDVLTFGPETEGTGEVTAKLGSSGIQLVSGDMLGTTANVEFAAAAADGYEVADWLVNGISQKVSDGIFTYKVPKDTRADVRAVFDRPVYSITWSSDEGGQIKAENVTAGEILDGGSVNVRGDRELRFTAEPDQYMECTGYTVTTAAGVKDYTAEELGGDILIIDKVESDIDVKAHFAKKELKVNITFAANDETLGNVTAVYGADKNAINSGEYQIAGGDVVFTATPAEGQMIEGWYTDPECTKTIDGAGAEQATYAAEAVYADMSVYVKFVEIPEYTVKVGVSGTGTADITAESDGEILDIVSGEVKVRRHKDLTVTVKPKDIYNTVEHWTIDGKDVDLAELTYKLDDVTADTSVYAYVAPSLLIDVVFKDNDTVKKYDNIDIKAGYVGEDGDISGLTSISAENNSVRIGSGKDVRFAITPKDDYMIQSWTVKYIRGGKVVNEESGTDFGFTNEILLSDVTTSIEVSAELVDKIGYYIPDEGSYSRANELITTTDEETAYTVSELTKIPDNVVFRDDRDKVISNMVRKNGDASVVITPADGWRIRDISVADAADQTENIMSVTPVLADDGTETGAYKVTAENVTKNVEFTVDAVKLYTVTIADSENGNVNVTRQDGTEVKSGEILDEGTVLKYTAVPDQYYDFDAWTDDAAGQTESTFEQALSGNTTVGAAFKARFAKVNIAAATGGKITVMTADGNNVVNGQLVQEGTEIVCKAVPAQHCDLAAWGGDVKGKSGTTVKLIVTKDMTISAAFKYRYVKVRLVRPVNGTITVKTADGKTIKDGSSVKEGTVLVCTAKAAKNCKLSTWSGSFTSKKTSVRVAANKNMTIGAKFAAQIPAQNTAGINKNIQATANGKSLTIKWGKVEGAAGYDVFMQSCYRGLDTKNPVYTVKGAANTKAVISKMHGTALSKYDIVKTQVRAYKLVNGKKKYIDTSVLLHTVINSDIYTNIKTVTLAKKAYTMSVKQAVTLKPIFKAATASKKLLGSNHGPRVFYYSTNTNVATVDSKGVVRAKASGKCTIYVISISGVTSPVQITVR